MKQRMCPCRCGSTWDEAVTDRMRFPEWGTRESAEASLNYTYGTAEVWADVEVGRRP